MAVWFYLSKRQATKQEIETMSMEFDKRPQRSQTRKTTASKAEKQRGLSLLFNYPRNWKILQTRFLEDLILS